MFVVVTLLDEAAPRNLFGLQQRWPAVKNKDQFDSIIGNETRRAVEQPGEMRRDAAVGVLQRRPIAHTDQREKLIQFRIRINGKPFSTQVAKRQALLEDYWSQ